MQFKINSLLSICSILIFFTMAIFGWIKLKYGFNFEDEGMYMVDGWRLTVGDRLFPDSAINASMLYVVFNALIFKLSPDISLLEFRQLQFVLALTVIVFFGIAIYRWSKKLWPIPLVLAVFAFTGLDTLGNNSNLSYYTYPHFFVTLHIALLIFALTTQGGWIRSLMFIASGIALWAIGFSFLPLLATLISPVLLWLCTNHLDIKKGKFYFYELLLIISPGLFLWGGFLTIYNAKFFNAIFDIYRYGKGLGGGWINYIALEYIACVAAFWIIFMIVNSRSPRKMLVLSVVTSGLFFGIVDSNMAGLIQPYWSGFFSNPMWFSALLITFLAVASAHLIRQKRRNSFSDVDDGLILIILIPSIVFVLPFSHFSSIGILSVMYVAIPVTMVLALFLIRYLENRYSTNSKVLFSLTIAVLFPFAYHLAWADWKFTFFDLPPEKLSATIVGGFADGIKTNDWNHSMMQWLQTTSNAFSSEGELAIVMDQSPMVYMLIKRRPSLNHSWTGWGQSLSLRRDSVREMLDENRQPKIAYRFLALPIMWPISLKDGTYTFPGKYNYPTVDPIFEYVTSKMKYTDTYYLNGKPWVEFYVRR
jgi:hypothetical protein